MEKLEQIPVGVIGTGGMGGMHAENLHTRVANARLAAVSDVDAERAGKIAERYGSAAVFTFLAGSKPRSLSPTPVVLAVCESTMAALSWRSLPDLTRRRSRSSAFRRSQVPSMRHLLNQS
jgi:hypothetical protein